MHVRFTLIAAARSASVLGERFDEDRPLDGAGWRAVELAAPALIPLGAAELRYCSPTPRSRATGNALGFAPLVQPALSDWDMGRWRGRTLTEVASREPDAMDDWLTNPAGAPHGGESLLAFITRIGGWLDTRPAVDGDAVVAVAEPSVVRAALVYALRVPPETYWMVDVRPLAPLTLIGFPGRWHLCLGTPT
ncbi:histidine phosphatase family protein [Streptomyces sp. NPDC006879]|uniref:histidine phosphatase family protein n=1 Tax=Streptomyces sp. NPDC006879 TaxID=3364767 RepID=UPI0036B258E9